jgi:hypothetical protein
VTDRPYRRVDQVMKAGGEPPPSLSRTGNLTI